MEQLVGLIGGLLVGALFTWIKIPLPAPPTLTGILAAVGVYLGSVVFNFVAAYFHR